MASLLIRRTESSLDVSPSPWSNLVPRAESNLELQTHRQTRKTASGCPECGFGSSSRYNAVINRVQIANLQQQQWKLRTGSNVTRSLNVAPQLQIERMNNLASRWRHVASHFNWIFLISNYYFLIQKPPTSETEKSLQKTTHSDETRLIVILDNLIPFSYSNLSSFYIIFRGAGGEFRGAPWPQ